MSEVGPLFEKALTELGIARPTKDMIDGLTRASCWCKDRWGISWQITPRTLMEAMAAGGAEAKRAFEAMMTMKKIDVATIDAARRG